MTTKNIKPYPALDSLECKGCNRCVVSCPKDVLHLSELLNERGYHYTVYTGEGCIGCGNCFYTCPEPYAIKIVIPNSEINPNLD